MDESILYWLLGGNYQEGNSGTQHPSIYPFILKQVWWQVCKCCMESGGKGFFYGKQVQGWLFGACPKVSSKVKQVV